MKIELDKHDFELIHQSICYFDMYYVMQDAVNKEVIYPLENK